MSRTNLLPILLLIILTLTSCIQENNPAPALPSKSAVSDIPAPTVTAKETAAPIPTPSSTNTPNPSSQPPATSTTSPQPTTTPLPTESPQSQPLPHYNLDVSLDYASHTAQVEQTVTLSNNTADPWTEIVFNVSPAYWQNIFTIQFIDVSQDGETTAIQPQWASTMLHLPLPHPLQPGQNTAVNLSFILSLPQLDPLGWGPTGNAGWSENVTQFGDWYPALVPYQSGSGWQIWPYHPVGDPVRSALADYDVTITTTAEIIIAAPGLISDTAATKRYSLKKARSFSFLASPHFILLESTVGNIPIKVYVTPAHQSNGQTVLEGVTRSIALFSDLFGPFPYPEFIIAENGFLTANEYSALVSLSGFAFESDTGSAESLLVALTAHEVAHQWWYGLVGSDQVEEPWLDESLAMFSELLYYEHYHPESVDWWWSSRVDRWQPQGFVDVSIYDYSDSATYIHNMYGIATRFIRDLRTEMGQDVFLTFLADYYNQNSYQFATTEDFFNLVNTHLPAEKLTPLTQIYFQNPPLK